MKLFDTIMLLQFFPRNVHNNFNLDSMYLKHLNYLIHLNICFFFFICIFSPSRCSFAYEPKSRNNPPSASLTRRFTYRTTDPRIDYGRESGNVLTSGTSHVSRRQRALRPRHVVARTSRRFHVDVAWDCHRTGCREIKRKKFTSIAYEKVAPHDERLPDGSNNYKYRASNLVIREPKVILQSETRNLPSRER